MNTTTEYQAQYGRPPPVQQPRVMVPAGRPSSRGQRDAGKRQFESIERQIEGIIALGVEGTMREEVKEEEPKSALSGVP